MINRLLERDASWSRRMRIAEMPGTPRTLAATLAHSGDSWFWLLGLIIIGWLGSPYWKARALAFGVGILVTAVIVLTIKFTVRRRRPEGEWGAIYRSTDPHSFPSGHAARAALIAVLGVATGPAWLGILVSVWAPLVILARVVMGVHYLSDVVAGALLGFIMGIGLQALFPLF